MASRLVGFALSLFLFSVLLGCSVVATDVPLSDAPKPVDQAKLEGAWMLNDGVLHLRFGSDGVARLAGLEWRDESFVVARGEVIVVEGLEFNYLSIRGEEGGEWIDYHLLAQYDFTPDGDLLVWLPDEHVFAAAVRDGKLEGVVDTEGFGTDVLITAEPEVLLDFMNDTANQGLFEYKEPMVFRKVAGGAG